jgi:hypothetical protein
MSTEWVPIATVSGIAAKQYLDSPVPQGEKRRFRVKAVQGNFTSEFSNWAEGIGGEAPTEVHNVAALSTGTNIQFSAATLVDVAVESEDHTSGSNLVTGTVPVAPTDTFFTDFSGDSVGQLPAGTTVRNGGAFTVQSTGATGITGSRYLRLAADTGDYERFLSWNFAGSRSNVEIVTRCQFDTMPSWGNQLIVRSTANPESTSWMSYHHAQSASVGDVGIGKYVSGAWTSGPESSYPVNINTWFRMRLRANGTTVSVKIWADGAAEPGSWTHTWTSQGTTSGLAGVGAYYGGRNYNFDWIGIGIDGATAPQSGTSSSVIWSKDFQADSTAIPAGTSWQQQNFSYNSTDGQRVIISSGDRWGGGRRTRFHQTATDNGARLGISTRDSVYLSWMQRFPTDGSMMSGSTATNGDTKFGFGLGGLPDSQADGYTADGDNKLQNGDTFSVRMQGRAQRDSFFYGITPTGGPFVELYVYAYYALGQLWTNNTRTANWGFHRELRNGLGGTLWIPQGGQTYKMTIYAQRNSAGSNNGILRAYVNDNIMLEWTDVRFTQADNVPINQLMNEALTNGTSNNEVWNTSKVWLHTQLGD